MESLLTEEEREFRRQWIAGDDIPDITVYWDAVTNTIQFREKANISKVLHTITDVPRDLGKSVIHTGDGIRYQYVNELYFNREDLESAGLLP